MGQTRKYKMRCSKCYQKRRFDDFGRIDSIKLIENLKERDGGWFECKQCGYQYYSESKAALRKIYYSTSKSNA